MYKLVSSNIMVPANEGCLYRTPPNTPKNNSVDLSLLKNTPQRIRKSRKDFYTLFENVTSYKIIKQGEFYISFDTADGCLILKDFLFYWRNSSNELDIHCGLQILTTIFSTAILLISHWLLAYSLVSFDACVNFIMCPLLYLALKHYSMIHL